MSNGSIPRLAKQPRVVWLMAASLAPSRRRLACGDAVLYLYQQTQAIQFQLYLPVVGQGAVTVNPPGTYSAGQQVTLSAIPAAGWTRPGMGPLWA